MGVDNCRMLWIEYVIIDTPRVTHRGRNKKANGGRSVRLGLPLL